MRILALDQGTTSTRGLVADETGACEIVHAVLRLCGVAVTGAAEVDAFAGEAYTCPPHAQ